MTPISSGQHIGVAPITGKKVEPIKKSAVRDQFFDCNYLPSFDNCRILTHKNKTFFIENQRKPSNNER